MAVKNKTDLIWFGDADCSTAFFSKPTCLGTRTLVPNPPRARRCLAFALLPEQVVYPWHTMCGPCPLSLSQSPPSALNCPTTLYLLSIDKQTERKEKNSLNCRCLLPSLSLTLHLLLTRVHAHTHSCKTRNQLEPSGLLDAAVLYLLKGRRRKAAAALLVPKHGGSCFNGPGKFARVCKRSGLFSRLLIDCQQFVRQSRHIGAPTKAVFVAGPGFLSSSALRSACFLKRHWCP